VRFFNEAEQRAILSDAIDMTEQGHGTFLMRSRHENKDWEVYLIPDFEKELIVIVSACAVS
jgi:hypothetical protein